jgi:hypothetical protein
VPEVSVFDTGDGAARQHHGWSRRITLSCVTTYEVNQ